MTEKMTAAVMHAVGDIRMEEVDKPTPGPGEVLMRVAWCGVCGSDLSRMFESGPHKLPLICGHEFSAWIDELGEGVEGFAVGDLVTVPPMLPCFDCPPCVQGQFSLCEDYDYYGSRRHGAYAPFVVGPAKLLLTVPKDMDPRAAAMVDPAAISLHAIYRTKLGVGDRVAVLGGGGPIGLFSVQWAKLAGASEVVAIDVSAEKAELARQAGADHATSSDAELEALVGKGFDLVIDTTGVAACADQAVRITARHGQVVLIGIPHTDVPIKEKTWARLMRLEIDILGSWNSFSAPFPGKEWETTVAKMCSGELKWEFMITHQEPFSAVPELIGKMARREVISSKVLFGPEGSQ